MIALSLILSEQVLSSKSQGRQLCTRKIMATQNTICTCICFNNNAIQDVVLVISDQTLCTNLDQKKIVSSFTYAALCPENKCHQSLFHYYFWITRINTREKETSNSHNRRKCQKKKKIICTKEHACCNNGWYQICAADLCLCALSKCDPLHIISRGPFHSRPYIQLLLSLNYFLGMQLEIGTWIYYGN